MKSRTNTEAKSPWTERFVPVPVVVARAMPYRDLSREQFENVLALLGGAFPGDDLADLRPRVVWDREAGTYRTRADAARIAITNAGTIPDRGLYGVFLVGELPSPTVKPKPPLTLVILIETDTLPGLMSGASVPPVTVVSDVVNNAPVPGGPVTPDSALGPIGPCSSRLLAGSYRLNTPNL